MRIGRQRTRKSLVARDCIGLCGIAKRNRRPRKHRRRLSPCRRSKWRWVTSHCGHQWNGVRMWASLRITILSAERLLALWMERAWRRPVSSGERKPFFALYRKVRQQGAGFDAALRSAFHSVLMSAPFRYLSPATESQHAIASRLSFMLTGAPPDATLRRLARSANSAMPRCSMHRLTGCWLIRAATRLCGRLSGNGW